MTLDKAGTFKFHCEVHPAAMKGVVTVTGEAAAAGPAQASAGPREIDVGAVDFAFEPKDASVAAGGKVTVTNNGQAPHTMTLDDVDLDTGNIDPGAPSSPPPTPRAATATAAPSTRPACAASWSSWAATPRTPTPRRLRRRPGRPGLRRRRGPWRRGHRLRPGHRRDRRLPGRHRGERLRPPPPRRDLTAVDEQGLGGAADRALLVVEGGVGQADAGGGGGRRLQGDPVAGRRRMR